MEQQTVRSNFDSKTKMENPEKASYRAHCLVLCFPLQGHINPMIQFSKRLQHKGIKVTLSTTYFMSKSMHRDSWSSIALEPISDGFDEGGFGQARRGEDYWERFWEVGPRNLTELVEKLGVSGCPVDCIVYDSFLTWGLDVARKLGLVGAVFLTQSCAVDSIYYHVIKGLLKLPLADHEVLLPGLPPLAPRDMPSFIRESESNPHSLHVMARQFSDVEKADWVLCNTFLELEEEVAEWLKKLWRLRTIGPTIPSMYLDKQLEDDKDYGFSIYQPDIDSCMKWLNDRAKGSVVYVSLGSFVPAEAQQMEELAWGLRSSDKYFLWVVRASEQAKLPEKFSEETTEKGLVVTWSPQLEVLAHEATGCFVTHCGWNSTLEALSLGVPMVTVPLWSDQSTNARCIVDAWKMGFKAPADEKGIVRREAIEACIREIMEGDRGKEIKNNADKWSKLAKEAMAEGGSSDKDINEFIDHLVSSKNGTFSV